MKVAVRKFSQVSASSFRIWILTTFSSEQSYYEAYPTLFLQRLFCKSKERMRRRGESFVCAILTICLFNSVHWCNLLIQKLWMQNNVLWRRKKEERSVWESERERKKKQLLMRGTERENEIFKVCEKENCCILLPITIDNQIWRDIEFAKYVDTSCRLKDSVSTMKNKNVTARLLLWQSQFISHLSRQFICVNCCWKEWK